MAGAPRPAAVCSRRETPAPGSSAASASCTPTGYRLPDSCGSSADACWCAGTLGGLLEHHHDAAGDHGLPLSPSEVNLAAWASAGTGLAEAAGDLASIPGIPRNFSLSDLTFDQEGVPRITSLADLAVYEQGLGHSSQAQAQAQGQAQAQAQPPQAQPQQ